MASKSVLSLLTVLAVVLLAITWSAEGGRPPPAFFDLPPETEADRLTRFQRIKTCPKSKNEFELSCVPMGKGECEGKRHGQDCSGSTKKVQTCCRQDCSLVCVQTPSSPK